MEIFGWIVLVLLAAFSCASTLIIFVGSIAFSGKVGVEWIFPGGVAAALVYSAYQTFPFVVTVAP